MHGENNSATVNKIVGKKLEKIMQFCIENDALGITPNKPVH